MPKNPETQIPFVPETDPSARTFEPRGPVVFMFQPTHIREVKTSEDLKEWERLMSTRVGIRVSTQRMLAAQPKIRPYISTCPGGYPAGMDD